MSELLCVMGPTATGKTDLAVALAKHLDGELISVDSALVYRGLEIGAAKPDYPHHLVGIRDPSEPYNAAQFALDAKDAIAAIKNRGRLPILVGGTMLYFKALLEGLDDIPASDPGIRRAIEAEARARGWPALHDELTAVDPRLAERLHPNHSQRIGRGLEVWRMTGKPLSEWQASTPLALPLSAFSLVISPAERRVLHDRIARRFDGMLSAGLLDEVAALRARGDLSSDLPALRAVGYRQLWQYLSGEVSLPEAREKAIAATRQLAKRQLTWLRGWACDAWLLTGEDGAWQSVAEACPPAAEVMGEALAKTTGVPCPLAQQQPLLHAIGSLLGN